MPKICYEPKDFQAKTLAVIATANEILAEYAADGLQVTLRQLYYQFVARGLMANRQTEYKRLGGILSDARLAGLVDWEAIEDRTRELINRASWGSPASIVDSAAWSYRRDKWALQEYRPEVWVEKEALIGVIDRTARDLFVPAFACRGYVSQSELWSAAQRMRRWNQNRQQAVVIHLGDHDPSGVDMTRDIRDRLELFGAKVEVIRIALNFDQVEEYSPPPNPAKFTDSRIAGYVDRFGEESWELDALDPRTLDGLIREAVGRYRDEAAWEDEMATEKQERAELRQVSDRWEEVADFLEESAPESEEDFGEEE